jgi:hypothetical protein
LPFFCNPERSEGSILKEDFDKVLPRFKDFLRSNGFPPHLVWLTHTDVLLTGSELLYVRYSDPQLAEVAARGTFEKGSRRGNGLLLKGLFSKEDITYSCIWVPEDREEAQYALLPPIVKLAVNTSQTFKLVIVQSDEKWQSLAKRHRDEQVLIMQLFQ